MIISLDLVLKEHTLGKAAVTGSFYIADAKKLRTEFSLDNRIGS
jgi:hypothetical protein